MRIPVSRYYLKVAGFVLALSTVPVILLGTAAYWKSSAVVREQVVQGNTQVLLQTHMRIEKELKLIEQMANHLANSSSVNRMLGQSIDERDFIAVNQIQQSLTLFNSYELGIRDAYLYSLEAGWFIGASSVYVNGRERVGENELAEYTDVPQSAFWLAETAGGPRGVIRLVKKLPLYSAKPLGIMVVSVSVPDLQTLLADNELVGSTLLLDRSYRQIASNGAESPAVEAVRPNLAAVLDERAAESGSFVLSAEGGDLAVTYRHSPYNGWMYVSLAPIREMTEKSRDIGWYTFYACAALVLMTVAVSLLGSSRIYRPVRKLYHTVLGPSDQPPPRGDELEAIGERYRSEWRLRHELSAKLARQLPQLKEFYLLKLVSGDAAEAAQKLAELGIGLPAAGYHALVLQIDTLQDTRFEERDRDLLLFAINNMVGELIETVARLDPVVAGQSQITIVGSRSETPAMWKREASERARQVQQKVRELWGLSVSIGISLPFDHLRHAGKACEEAHEALKYRLRLGHEAILFYADVVPVQPQGSTFPRKLLDELVDAIKLADRQSAGERLHAFIADVVRDEVSHQVYRVSFVRLLAELLHVAQETAGRLEDVAGDRLPLFEQLFQLQSAAEIEVWFREALIHPLIQTLEEKRRVRFQTISDEVKQLIELHYDTDLTLELCAERLNYHPVYVSRIFRKETGMNFTEYLSRHRLAMAKRLLAETALSVAEIAQKIGYHNGPNFSRHFKKVEGLTPGQYRESARSQAALPLEAKRNGN